ncbi:MAG: LacI family DNA-binding transcriptional regulator [Amycolatopsis sp.]|nr:LacI family DNA-binding transcriptional regulator [Amycolatopsis sp.]
MVNMKDVAREAGVSQAAVSYAYSRPGKLSDGQRLHIMETATRLGYAGPNIVGASLRSGKIGAIGVMLMDTLEYAFTDPSTRALLEGVVQSHKFDDLALTLLPLPHDAESLQPQNGGDRSALQGLVDGVIVHSLPDDHSALLTLQSRGIPMVIVDAPRLAGVPLVGIPDRQAARGQLDHVLRLGHQRVGIIVERLAPDGFHGRVSASRRVRSTEGVVRERVEGYRESYEAAGGDFQRVPIIEAGAFDLTSGSEAAHALLDNHDVTAVVTTSDTMAIAALKAAGERGLRVPEDLSIIGFDDAYEAERWGLTTIRQPMVEKGTLAATMLFDMLRDNSTPASVSLPTELIVRQTTAQPTR